MDTLVFLCQHTCTMVLPRWGVGFSSEVCEAAMSSSDSASAEESSGHSGKVRRLLLLDNEQGDEGRRELEHRQRQVNVKSNRLVSGISVSCFLTVTVCFIHCLLFTYCPNKRPTQVNTVCLINDLLLSVRRSDEGPLLVFAISIAVLMSSIHFSISVNELHRKYTHLNSAHSREACWLETVLLTRMSQILSVSCQIRHHLLSKLANCGLEHRKGGLLCFVSSEGRRCKNNVNKTVRKVEMKTLLMSSLFYMFAIFCQNCACVILKRCQIKESPLRYTADEKPSSGSFSFYIRGSYLAATTTDCRCPTSVKA